MADVRALLAAERQSRRISHPHLTYTKSGALICNVCQLNVKSESLWEGHLRSANHRKNARTAQEASQKSLKRRRDDDDDGKEDEQSTDKPNADIERRKMPKSRATSLAEREAKVRFQEEPEIVPPMPSRPAQETPDDDPSVEPDAIVPPAVVSTTAPVQPPAAPSNPAVDEDEWAAFEADIAPLASAPPSAEAPDYSAATISAAPLSAAQLAEQQAEDKRKQQELTAEDEQEDERGRMEEEFEIMEEMEERVRKLKEMREKLRAVGGLPPDEMQPEPPEQVEVTDATKGEESEDVDDDESDPDDWYH